MFFSSSTTSTVTGMRGMVIPDGEARRKSFDSRSKWSQKVGSHCRNGLVALAPGGFMRRVLLLVLCVSGAFALTACPAKPKQGECKTSADCTEQQGFGKICIE